MLQLPCFPNAYQLLYFYQRERERQREFPAKGYLQVHTVWPYAATSNKSLTPSVPSRLPWDWFCGARTNLCRLLQYGGQAGLAPQLFTDMASLQMFAKWSFEVQLSTATLVFKNKRDTGDRRLLSKNKAHPVGTSPNSSVLAWNASEKVRYEARYAPLLSAALKSVSFGAGAHWRNHPRAFGLAGCSCTHSLPTHVDQNYWGASL